MATDHHPTYTIAEAARQLGVSENAVRKRIRRGALDAHKEGDRWLVALPDHPPANVAATAVVLSATTPAITDQVVDNGATPPSATTGVAGDLAAAIQPLADLIADLQQENRRLAESATLWQERARGLQEQMKALTAGESVPDASISRPAPPGAAEAPSPSDDSYDYDSSSGFWGWWRRLWSGA